ncbi:rev protein [Simian immunodeficiency virus]|uniref:Rev protein n=1 Tax=Simian immunodeficiency virus TaxID=11723 RepID=Q7ZB14_SIV|nr:rev protein [Simian immunodeficiency virus]
MSTDRGDLDEGFWRKYQAIVKQLWEGISPSSLCLQGRLSPAPQPQTARQRRRRRARLRKTEHQVRELQTRI